MFALAYYQEGYVSEQEAACSETGEHGEETKLISL